MLHITTAQKKNLKLNLSIDFEKNSAYSAMQACQIEQKYTGHFELVF